MTTITFADHELEELENFYQLELDKVTKRAEDIKGILQKISGQKEQSPFISQKEESVITETRQSKPTRRNNKTIAWRKFIPKLLKREDRYLNIHEIAKTAMEKFNLTDRVKILRTLSTTLASMTRMGILKSEKQDGQKNKGYGLTSWTGKAPIVSTNKETSSKEDKIELSATPIQRKRKSKTIVIPWKKFIPQLIKKEGSLTIHEFADAAMKQFKYPDRDKLVRTLSPTLARMSKTGKLTFDRKPGQKTHLYGLPSVPAKVKATNGIAVALT